MASIVASMYMEYSKNVFLHICVVLTLLQLLLDIITVAYNKMFQNEYIYKLGSLKSSNEKNSYV